MQPPVIHNESLNPGLYIVATPIGNLGDISMRAITTLASVDVIACEDTRVTGKLLKHYDIKTPTMSYHEHNAELKRPEMIADLKRGRRIALVSDAGTPLISDPGYKLVKEAAEADVKVIPIPGASSVFAALCVSALPTDRFTFLGFLPATDGATRTLLTEWKPIKTTLVFFESARRVKDTMPVLAEFLGAAREACVARELTKLYEEAVRGTLEELAQHYANVAEPKGEVVIVVGPPSEEAVSDETIDAALKRALKDHSVKDAAQLVADALGVPKKHVYQRALELK